MTHPLSNMDSRDASASKNVPRTGSGKVMENLPRATRVQSAIDQSVCTMCHRATVNHLAESMIQLSRG